MHKKSKLKNFNKRKNNKPKKRKNKNKLNKKNELNKNKKPKFNNNQKHKILLQIHKINNKKNNKTMSLLQKEMGVEPISTFGHKLYK